MFEFELAQFELEELDVVAARIGKISALNFHSHRFPPGLFGSQELDINPAHPSANPRVWDGNAKLSPLDTEANPPSRIKCMLVLK